MGLSAEIADLTFTVTAAAIETAEHNVTTSDTTSNVPIMIDESRKALTALAALGPPLVALDELGTTRVETGVHTVRFDFRNLMFLSVLTDLTLQIVSLSPSIVFFFDVA